jgi:cytochrome P450
MRERTEPSIQNAEQGIWSKLAALQNAGNPLGLLLQIARNGRGCIPLQMGSQRVLLVTAPEDFKQVLATNSARYGKYLEGMRPIFGKSMITMDGALWQKMRAIQQPAFHPDALAEYVPHFFAAIDRRLDRWRNIDPDTPLDIGAETWALAVDMISRALFDRDTPHNPYFVYKAVEVFTTVGNHHPSPRRPSEGQATDELTLEQAIAAWGALPEQVLAAPALESRERTLLRLIEAAAVDPEAGEFDVAQVMDEIKQYIWAGTETTALVLGWAIYLTATRPDVAERIRLEAERVFAHEEPNPAAYERLSYTRKVIAETMRMYPPIWSMARRAESEDVLGGQAVKTEMWCCFGPMRSNTTHASGLNRPVSIPNASTSALRRRPPTRICHSVPARGRALAPP